METSTPSADMEHRIMSGSPGLRRLMYRFVQVPTLADSLPSIFQVVSTSGKVSGFAVVSVYLVFVLLWLPFWLLSFFVSELGVYAFSVAAIFYFGRAVVRMIAFPGASSKVLSEVESEFAKYSVRMLIASANCLRELASAFASTGDVKGSISSHELSPLWKRTMSYRDRALGVYLEVLTYIYEQPVPASPQSGNQRTQFGTNRIVGDIGNLSGLTPQAREDGRELVRILKKLMFQLNQLEGKAEAILNGTTGGRPVSSMPEDVQETANMLLASANELRDFVSSLKPPCVGGDGRGDDEDVMRGAEEPSGGAMDAIKGGLSSILPMLDPPQHTSIFGIDVLRGTVLSRYLGARQLWVQRPSGGMLDVLHIPARNKGPNTRQSSKAVMYCNPNAGLYEVATGMSLAGGNIGEDSDSKAQDAEACWTDFYTELGFDIYLFNYAGFGRSYGTSMCASRKSPNDGTIVPGIIGRLSRILRASFLAFKPTPDTLREDGVALANSIVREFGVESLVIHGESIGGVAASRSAHMLSQSPSTRDKLSLLVCDRTFCNLEAVAQRLVGSWSGYAIRILAPLWNTDVAGDFLAARCPKVVANDFSDAIIADASSLKTGVALWREIQRGVSATRGIGWMTETPVEYRMADWENVCVVGSQYVAASHANTCAPVWPQDKHVTLAEAFHFAACAKSIGRHAKQGNGHMSQADQKTCIELGRPSGEASSPIRSAWEALACCDGLCGAPLGVAVKMGFDSTVAWLCCCLTYGGQILVQNAEQRVASTDRPPAVLPSDFDQRPEGYKNQESAKMVHPKPIPEVLECLKVLVADNKDVFLPVHHEIDFVVGMLEYILARLSSPTNVETCWKCKHGRVDEAAAVGIFLNLHCGHNSAFSKPEQMLLQSILRETAKM